MKELEKKIDEFVDSLVEDLDLEVFTDECSLGNSFTLGGEEDGIKIKIQGVATKESEDNDNDNSVDAMCEDIIKHYGLEHQLKKLQEETYEVIEAALKNKHRAEIALEIADVETILNQLRIYFGISKRSIDSGKKFKTQRTVRNIRRQTNGD